MARFLNVKGNPGLVRDKASGAIVNINNNEMQQARKRKKAWQKEKERNENLSREVDSLKQDMSEIKTLLRNILEVTNGNHHD